MSCDDEFVIRHTTRFSGSLLQTSEQSGPVSTTEHSDTLGGIIHRGQLAWIATGHQLEVVSIKSGCLVASYDHDSQSRSVIAKITCVAECSMPQNSSCVLAIGVQFAPAGGAVCIFSVQGSQVLRTIEFVDQITSCAFIPDGMFPRSIAHVYDGCLAVGTCTGKVILANVNMKQCSNVLYGHNLHRHFDAPIPMHTVLANLHFAEIRRESKQVKDAAVNFGVQLEAFSSTGTVMVILAVPALTAIAIGLADGRLILYDLTDLQAFHCAYPPEKGTPLVRLSFLEPTDDPRAVVYLWAFHSSLKKSAIAVMHSIMYAKKTVSKNRSVEYKDFEKCAPRLTLPLCDQGSIPIACQSMKKKSTSHEDETTNLCLLGWNSGNNQPHVILFDLNQWYKDQMPRIGVWREDPSYLAAFPLHKERALGVWLDTNSVVPFNSIQRPEEHFYPNSLSFDCLIMHSNSCRRLHWQGLQNRILAKLIARGPLAILNPSGLIEEMLSAVLVPQFSDICPESKNLSLNAQRELMLSVALEYNCVGLLKQCAKMWADGSQLGRQPFEGVSLSTLTEWIWQRASIIQECCNNFCVPLFDLSKQEVDLSARKVLSHCARQLRLLADLMEMVIVTCREYIPDAIFERLKKQQCSIRMSSEYQDVLQWLLNMGLLPEGDWRERSRDSVSTASSACFEQLPPTDEPIPYPYRILKNYYMSKRLKFRERDNDLLELQSQSCKVLFIDSFIENECNVEVLRRQWQEAGGNGLYPPASLQSMLRVLLVPDISLEKKYMLFLYFFLDLNMALDSERYTPVVQNLIKFPAVFNLNPSLIKTTQAFWNLDHDQFESAMHELISPLASDLFVSVWQLELLIEALLLQSQCHCALQALRGSRHRITPRLEMRTLLANNLTAEAFQLQKSLGGGDHLIDFFNGCWTYGKWNAILDLALTENEGRVLGEFLASTDLYFADNLHFVYLMQRSKYIEAVTSVDNCRRRRIRNTDEIPDLVLSAYTMTMTPTVRHLTETFYKSRDKFKRGIKKSSASMHPNPLSRAIIQGDLDLVGGIYQRSVESTTQIQNQKDCSTFVPFLSQPQMCLPSASTMYSERTTKRRLSVDDETESLATVGMEEVPPPSLKKQRFTEDGRPPVRTSMLTSFRSKDRRTLVRASQQSNSPLSTPSIMTSVPIATELSTPLVKVVHARLPESPPDSAIGQCTPQSILKVTNSIREGSFATSTRRSASPHLNVSLNFPNEPNTIKFVLSQSQNIKEQEEEVNDQEITIETSTPISKNNMVGGSKRSSIHSTDQSPLAMGNLSSSTEEFYSPEKSQNNSLLDESQSVQSISTHIQEIPPRLLSYDNEEVAMEIDDEIDEEIEPEANELIIPEQPTARRSLRSKTPDQSQAVPVERLGKVTKETSEPEKEYQTPVRITRSRSKTPECYGPYTDHLPKVTPLASTSSISSPRKAGPRKPLSRIVLEANALKVTRDGVQDGVTTAFGDEQSLSMNVSFETSASSINSDISKLDEPMLSDSSELGQSFLDKWSQNRTCDVSVGYSDISDYQCDKSPISLDASGLTRELISEHASSVEIKEMTGVEVSESQVLTDEKVVSQMSEKYTVELPKSSEESNGSEDEDEDEHDNVDYDDDEMDEDDGVDQNDEDSENSGRVSIEGNQVDRKENGNDESVGVKGDEYDEDDDEKDENDAEDDENDDEDDDVDGIEEEYDEEEDVDSSNNESFQDEIDEAAAEGESDDEQISIGVEEQEESDSYEEDNDSSESEIEFNAAYEHHQDDWLSSKDVQKDQVPANLSTDVIDILSSSEEGESKEAAHTSIDSDPFKEQDYFSLQTVPVEEIVSASPANEDRPDNVKIMDSFFGSHPTPVPSIVTTTHSMINRSETVKIVKNFFSSHSLAMKETVANNPPVENLSFITGDNDNDNVSELLIDEAVANEGLYDNMEMDDSVSTDNRAGLDDALIFDTINQTPSIIRNQRTEAGISLSTTVTVESSISESESYHPCQDNLNVAIHMQSDVLSDEKLQITENESCPEKAVVEDPQETVVQESPITSTELTVQNPIIETPAISSEQKLNTESKTSDRKTIYENYPLPEVNKDVIIDQQLDVVETESAKTETKTESNRGTIYQNYPPSESVAEAIAPKAAVSEETRMQTEQNVSSQPEEMQQMTTGTRDEIETNADKNENSLELSSFGDVEPKSVEPEAETKPVTSSAESEMPLVGDTSINLGGRVLRKTRARSTSIDRQLESASTLTPVRNARATSMPRTESIKNEIKETPKKRSHRTMSSDSAGDTVTPSRRKTRSSSILQPIDEDLPSTDDMTPSRMILRSASSMSEEPPATPRQKTRASSVASSGSNQSTPKSVTPRSAKTVSTSKVVSEVSPISSTEGEPKNIEDYSDSRRMTRRQSSQAKKMKERLASLPSLKDYVYREGQQEAGDAENDSSDTESIMSNQSKVSQSSRASNTSRKSKRSWRAVSKEVDDDAMSVASSTRSRTSRAGSMRSSVQKKPKTLTAISEEISGDSGAQSIIETRSKSKLSPKETAVEDSVPKRRERRGSEK